MTLNNIETNKINKKQSRMDLTYMCYTYIKVLNVNILLLTLFSSSAFNTNKNLCSSFYNTFGMEQFKFSPFIPLVCHSKVMYMSCEWLNII